ncbi:translation initiation factor IF-2 N-terminal domain-containing protein, partial [Chitinimonas sp.]|uniref:translation initiation factor IF-2 N-terminal domain-containing protein n=1 Tax=Chitinimonas sp. TaxID=1934313 RepID=UPI002F945529
MNVSQFAADLRMPPQHLLDQLRAAGVDKSGVDDALTEQDKTKLLSYLRSVHGSAMDKPKVTLARKQTSEIKKADASGKNRTIQVEVKKKRVVIAPEVSAAAAQPEQVAAAAVVAEEAVLEAVAAPVEVEVVAEPVVAEVPEVVVEAEPVVEAAPVEVEPEVAAPVEVAEVEAEAVADAAPAAAPLSRADVLGQAELDARAAQAARQRALFERQAADIKAKQDREAARKAAQEAAAKAAAEAAAAPKPASTEHTLHRAPSKPGEAKKDAKPAAADVKKAATPAKDGWGDGAKRRGGLKTRGGDAGAAGNGWKSGKKGSRNRGADDNAHGFQAPTEPISREVDVPETISVADLAHKMAVKAAEVIKVLMKMGMMVTINQVLDQETAMIVVEEMGHQAVAAR